MKHVILLCVCITIGVAACTEMPTENPTSRAAVPAHGGDHQMFTGYPDYLEEVTAEDFESLRGDKALETQSACTNCANSVIGITEFEEIYNPLNCSITLNWTTVGCPGTTELYWGNWKPGCFNLENHITVGGESSTHSVTISVAGATRVRWVAVSAVPACPEIVNVARCGGETVVDCGAPDPVEEDGEGIFDEPGPGRL